MNTLREFHFATVVLRLALALCAGGLIGYGRAKKRRSAGMRTYMLTCTGAALTMLIAMYEREMLYGGQWAWAAAYADIKFDTSRFSAQVINGVGFLAAGTIVVTRDSDIKGLTTAAGLWASGIIGLALGAGFYEGSILAALMVLFTEVAFARVGKTLRHKPVFTVVLRFRTKAALESALRRCKDRKFAITDLQVVAGHEDSTARVELRQRGDDDYQELLDEIRALQDISEAEVVEDGDS